MPLADAEGIHTSWRRSVLLISAITLHNIPEGLAVGVAFGAAASGISGASLGAALALAIGIGLQNFPEGTAVAMPLRREGMSRAKSFFFGRLSAVVEPVAGVLGAAAVILAKPILPYALAFAAGAMIFLPRSSSPRPSREPGHSRHVSHGRLRGHDDPRRGARIAPRQEADPPIAIYCRPR